VVNYNHASILHGYGDMEPQLFLGHDLDPLGSSDVIINHTVVGLAMWDSLKVVHYNHTFILIMFSRTMHHFTICLC